MRSSIELTDAVSENYRIKWGEPDRKAIFESSSGGVEVFKWDKSLEPGGVVTYGTIGGCLASKAGNRRVELNIGLDPAFDDIASVLAMVARAKNIASLRQGSTICYDQTLWEGTELNGFILLSNHRVLPPLPLSDGSHVDFMMVIPVHENERLICETEGERALLMKFREFKVPFWNALRGVAKYS